MPKDGSESDLRRVSYGMVGVKMLMKMASVVLSMTNLQLPNPSLKARKIW